MIIESMNFRTQFITCGSSRQNLSMRSPSWLLLAPSRNQEKSMILPALVMMTSMPVSKGASSATPSFNSTSSLTLLTARLSRADMVLFHQPLTSFPHLGYPVTILWRNCLFVFSDRTDTILEEGVLSQSKLFTCSFT